MLGKPLKVKALYTMIMKNICTGILVEKGGVRVVAHLLPNCCPFHPLLSLFFGFISPSLFLGSLS